MELFKHCRGCVRYLRICSGMSKEVCEKHNLRVPITNADRIRNMTDEQFANWLVKHVTDSPWCRPDAPVDPETKRCQIWDCEKCALEWLRQEAEQCTK